MKIVIDTREQTPWTFSSFGVETEKRGLPTGDYTIAGLEDHISIERKSFADFLGSIGAGRERFKREMHRLKAYDTRALIIEAAYSEIASGLIFAASRSTLHPNHVIGMIDSLIAFGIPVVLPGQRYAEVRAYNIMRQAYNRHVKSSKMFAGAKSIPAPPLHKDIA